MTQQELDKLKAEIEKERAEIMLKLDKISQALSNLNLQEIELDDPHALILKECTSLEECLENYPFSKLWLGFICKNRVLAERLQLACNNYQTHYHIVKCESREYYEDVIKSTL